MSQEKHPRSIQLRGGIIGSTEPVASEVIEELYTQLFNAKTPPAQLKALLELGLTGADLEKLTGNKSRKTISSWRRGEAMPRAGLADRLDDARYAAAVLLAENMEFNPPAELVGWMRTRERGLDGKRPLEVLAEGAMQQVIKVGLLYKKPNN